MGPCSHEDCVNHRRRHSLLAEIVREEVGDPCGRTGADEKRIGESHSWGEKWTWGSNNRRRGADAGLRGTGYIPRDLESRQRGSSHKCVCISHWFEGNSWTLRVRKENCAFPFREEMYSRVVKSVLWVRPVWCGICALKFLWPWMTWPLQGSPFFLL